MSELGMCIIRRQLGKFISVDATGSAISGGSFRILASAVDQMGFIEPPCISGMSGPEGRREHLHAEIFIYSVG